MKSRDIKTFLYAWKTLHFFMIITMNQVQLIYIHGAIKLNLERD